MPFIYENIKQQEEGFWNEYLSYSNGQERHSAFYINRYNSKTRTTPAANSRYGVKPAISVDLKDISY